MGVGGALLIGQGGEEGACPGEVGPGPGIDNWARAGSEPEGGKNGLPVQGEEAARVFDEDVNLQVWARELHRPAQSRGNVEVTGAIPRQPHGAAAATGLREVLAEGATRRSAPRGTGARQACSMSGGPVGPMR